MMADLAMLCQFLDCMMAGLARLCQFVDYMMAGLAVLCGLHDGQAHTTYIFRTFAVFTSLCCLTCSMLLVSCYRYTVTGPTLFGSWLLWASLPLFSDDHTYLHRVLEVLWEYLPLWFTW